ncbi:MAG: DNA repair protein RecN [Bacteroidaceae bacterium]|nr:DNA repair protein RecN [Bacteroidaceae bacterium]
MLKHLYIKNYTLIDTLDIDFQSGFSVITGETGAGKSIILGAVGLLLGQRAESKSIKDESAKCIVEAHFSFDEDNAAIKALFDENEIEFDSDDCIIRRELMASGKSRAFINDTPAPLSLLKEIGDKLMDIHSQHKNLLLGNEDFQLNVVDIIAGNETLRSDYTLLYNRYKESEKTLGRIRQQLDASKANEDFIRYQCEELSKANLETGELDALKEESYAISHAEDIKSALYNADETFNGDNISLLGNLKSALGSMESIVEVFPKSKEIAERLQSSYIELQDISRDVSSLLEEVDFDPMRMGYINDRLNLLNTLLKKYKVESDEELIAKRDELAINLSQIENSDEELRQAEKNVTEKLGVLMEKAAELTSSRTEAARKVEAEMQRRLIPLGIPNIRFDVHIEEKEPSADGTDRVVFYFSANKNAQPQPVAQIASGGEIARVMLSLKAMISGATQLPTIIFDEIDTGVSGKIAEKMAEMMAEIAHGASQSEEICKNGSPLAEEKGNVGRQVISITHLPQIAAYASNHYKVYKEDNDLFSETKMIQLSQEQRVSEIAAMLSGSTITDEALNNARALLKK